jgi:thiol-disulfide isomerase/thioredoxin
MTLSRQLATLLIGLVAAGGIAPVNTTAQSPAASVQPIYPIADARKSIDAAFQAAAKDGKYVLLDFGADWCPDCRVLGALLDDAAVAPVVSANFHVVRVDVGRRDKNGDVAEKYGATSGDWIPALVVLAPDASTVAVTNDEIRVTRRTTKDELLKLLQGWAPKARTHVLAEFVDRGVRVSLTLDRDRSGGWWLAGQFSPTVNEAHLYSTDLPSAGVQGLGRPTTIALVDGSSIRAAGPVVANRPVVADRVEGLGLTLPVYPAGDVTLRLPVVDAGLAHRRAEIVVSYMACGPRGCLAPVLGRRVAVTVPAR